MDQDVIAIEDRQPYKRPELTPWEESLKRVARAQAILWNKTSIAERMAILAYVDQELNKETK